MLFALIPYDLKHRLTLCRVSYVRYTILKLMLQYAGLVKNSQGRTTKQLG